MTRKERILALLQKGPESHTNLALILDCPSPSIRRSIQELIHEGHNISWGDNHSGVYTLGPN